MTLAGCRGSGGDGSAETNGGTESVGSSTSASSTTDGTASTAGTTTGSGTTDGGTTAGGTAGTTGGGGFVPLPTGTAVLVEVDPSGTSPTVCYGDKFAAAGPHECATVRIEGCGDPKIVHLRKTGPSDSGTPTVVLGVGGSMSLWYELQRDDATMTQTGALLVDRLMAAGMTVIQRAWEYDAPDPMAAPDVSVWAGAAGHQDVFCRYATLIEAIHADTFVDGGGGTSLGWHDPGAENDAFCVSGASGGSSEILMALARFGVGEFVDLAVPTGATPFGATDHGCMADGRVTAEGLDWAQYKALCEQTFRSMGILDGDGQWASEDDYVTHCTYNDYQRAYRVDSAYDQHPTNKTPCTGTGDPQDDAAVLRAGSIVSTDGFTMSFPTTAVHLIIGDANNGPDPINGQPVFEALLSDPVTEAVIHVVGKQIPHDIQSTMGGVEIIGDALLGESLVDPAYEIVDYGGVMQGFGCVDRDGG